MLAGSLDTSFGAGGTIYTLAGMGGASEVAAQTGGKIIVGAHVLGAGKAVLVRYNADGSIDASFGSDGVIVFNTGAGWLYRPEAELPQP